MIKIPDFTKKELDYIKDNANFTERELNLFELRNKEHSIEECAEIMNVSTSTIDRVNRKMKNKIIRILWCIFDVFMTEYWCGIQSFFVQKSKHKEEITLWMILKDDSTANQE